MKETIKNIIESELKNNPKEIILNNIKIEKIPKSLKNLIEDCEEVYYISLENCDLRSLQNFPTNINLVELNLNNNNFPSSDLKKISKLKDLQILSLENNNIKNIEEIKILQKCENLIQLNFQNTVLSKKKNYRKNIFGLFKNLLILDNLDGNGKYINCSVSDEYNESDFNDSESEDIESESSEEEEDKEYYSDNSVEDDKGDDGDEGDEDDEGNDNDGDLKK